MGYHGGLSGIEGRSGEGDYFNLTTKDESLLLEEDWLEEIELW
jgi:hypothetical protein